jgi:Domain of unknown function (DUF397)
MSESLRWVKSSYSSTGNCVEVAGQPGRMLVRDTKDQSGPVLGISAEAWRRFTGRIKNSLAVAMAFGLQPARRDTLIAESAPDLAVRMHQWSVAGQQCECTAGAGSGMVQGLVLVIVGSRVPAPEGFRTWCAS